MNVIHDVLERVHEMSTRSTINTVRLEYVPFKFWSPDGHESFDFICSTDNIIHLQFCTLNIPSSYFQKMRDLQN